MNVACGEAITVNEVVRILSELIGRPIRAVHKPERPGDIRHSHAEVTIAREKLGFKARTSVRDGLARTLAWAKDRKGQSS
jgi:nucleoside-diphosphate-sugar epimerase